MYNVEKYRYIIQPLLGGQVTGLEDGIKSNRFTDHYNDGWGTSAPTPTSV